LGRGALALLNTAQSAPMAMALTVLINAIATLPYELVLIVGDYST
jgi:hypothetical protein